MRSSLSLMQAAGCHGVFNMDGHMTSECTEDALPWDLVVGSDRGVRTEGLPGLPQTGPSRAFPRSSGECLLHPSAAAPMEASMQMLQRQVRHLLSTWLQAY